MVEARERQGDWPAFLEARRHFFKRNFAQELLASEKLTDYVIEAARLDPEVEPSRIEAAAVTIPSRGMQTLGVPAGEALSDAGHRPLSTTCYSCHG